MVGDRLEHPELTRVQVRIIAFLYSNWRVSKRALHWGEPANRVVRKLAEVAYERKFEGPVPREERENLEVAVNGLERRGYVCGEWGFYALTPDGFRVVVEAGVPVVDGRRNFEEYRAWREDQIREHRHEEEEQSIRWMTRSGHSFGYRRKGGWPK